MSLPAIDRLCGIDRAPESPAFGRVVVGGAGQIPILMWKQIGCEPIADNLSGAMRHNDKVTVKRHKEFDGGHYFFVQGKAEFKGVTYVQHGWVSAAMLNELGEKYKA